MQKKILGVEIFWPEKIWVHTNSGQKKICTELIMYGRKILKKCSYSPFPTWRHICSRKPVITLLKKEGLFETSNFSFCNNVFQRYSTIGHNWKHCDKRINFSMKNSQKKGVSNIIFHLSLNTNIFNIKRDIFF